MSPRAKWITKGSQPKPDVKAVRRVLSPDQLLTTNELMRFLQVRHRKTIYRLIKTGLPKIVVGRRFRFIKEEIIEFLRDKSEMPKMAKDHGHNSEGTQVK